MTGVELICLFGKAFYAEGLSIRLSVGTENLKRRRRRIKITDDTHVYWTKGSFSAGLEHGFTLASSSFFPLREELTFYVSGFWKSSLCLCFYVHNF